MKSAIKFGVFIKYSPYSTFLKQNILEKNAVAVLQNAKIMKLVEESKWQEALLTLEQSKILNHGVNNTSVFLESLIYKIGYNRSDKAEEALDSIKNNDQIFYNHVKSLVDMISKTKDTFYKMEAKDIKRLIEMTQDIEIQRFKPF